MHLSNRTHPARRLPEAQRGRPYIVLAFLTANDSIQPTEPPSCGLATQRHEYACIPHRDKTIVGRYLPDLDPDPDKANLCCNQAFTGRIIPDKLILRSGWNPGNFFVLVELAPPPSPTDTKRCIAALVLTARPSMRPEVM